MRLRGSPGLRSAWPTSMPLQSSRFSDLHARVETCSAVISAFRNGGSVSAPARVFFGPKCRRAMNRSRSSLSQDAIYLSRPGYRRQRQHLAALRRAIEAEGIRLRHPLQAAARARRASICRKSSCSAAVKLRTRLRQPRRRQDCDPLRIKSCYRNSGELCARPTILRPAVRVRTVIAGARSCRPSRRRPRRCRGAAPRCRCRPGRDRARHRAVPTDAGVPGRSV